MHTHTHHLATRVFLTLVLFILSNLAIADASSRQAYVIELQNQPPENLIQTIKPLLGDGDGISSYDNELIITTDAQHIATIRQLVEQLDKPLLNLLISVKNNNEGSVTTNSDELGGEIKQGQIILGTGKPVTSHKDGVTIESHGLSYTTRTTRQSFSTRAQQQVRAIEGSPAFIYTGQSINLPTRDANGNVYNTEVDANKGFYVNAHVNGDRVQLEITVSNDAFDQNSQNHNGPVRNTQRLSTSVSGRVGEWISLSGITLGDSNNSNSTVKKITTSAGSLGDISVKISPVE